MAVAGRAVSFVGRNWFPLPATTLLLALSALPFLELLRMSVSDVGFGNVATGDWAFTGLDNFDALRGSPAFGETVRNTAIFVTIVVLVSVAGGLAIAHLLMPATVPRRIVQAMLVFAWALPPVVSGSAWKFLLFSNSVVSSVVGAAGVEQPPYWLADPDLALFSVAAVNAWAATPFTALVFKAGLLDIPRDTLEAAEVDGASARQRFWFVVLPQLRPVVLVLGVLVTVYAFRSFDFLFVMTQGGPGTASSTLPYLAYLLSFRLGFFGRGAVAALITGACIAVLAFIYVRAFRRGTQ